MSSLTARTCAMIISGGIACTPVTPTVFCAVIAVIAVIPCTPQATNAFRSAWMPAPPPESEPAIESTRGILWLLGIVNELRSWEIFGQIRTEISHAPAGARRHGRLGHVTRPYARTENLPPVSRLT